MVTPKDLIQNSKTDLGWASASQNEKDALIIAARSLTGFRSSMRNGLAGGSESHKKALEALLQDCLKKHSEISKNLAIKCARKRTHDHENTDEEDDISDADEAVGTAVAFWVCDPEIGGHRDINGWIWDERDRRRLGVIQTMTLDGIWDMVKAHVPADRKEDFAKDSDANVRNVAGVRRRRMPTKDHAFEQRKYELRGRVARQQETLNNIKKEHKCLFPNAGIIDSDDEGYCYIRCLKRPKITSSPQLVKARQVVAIGRRATRLNRLLGIRRMVS
ncbi:hypothetical protein BGX38DRAFT_1146212 [Terfezia claveryi]|nr:hypothetical protein BGX38DRAFT_1146212 [Terfezia claveryi]